MQLFDTTLALRVILLAAGALLIVVLVWLDRRRRQAGGSAELADDRGDAGAEHGGSAGNASLQREEPQLAGPRAGVRDGSAHRPLPVIDWSALERDGGATDEDEPPLAVHTMSPGRAHGAGDDARHPGEARDVGGSGVFTRSPNIDHWPPEDARRICSLRVSPPAGEKFSGRVLRQGLHGTGFVHGVLGIFHHADEQGRALISAANLARPGQLDPAIMDFQRFSGLHLFSVLPGPIPDAELLAQLFSIAAELAGRVGGLLQDERGATLTSARRHELLYQFAGAPLPVESAASTASGAGGDAPAGPTTAP